MGMDRVSQTLQALKDAEIQAKRGFPKERMPQLTEPVVTVHVERISEEETVLLVRVFSAQDGAQCEDLAWQVKNLLAGLDALCVIGPCRYENQAGVFFCEVTASWQKEADCTVRVLNKTLQYAVEVTTERELSRVRVLDAETGETVEECRDQGWTITIEERLPADYQPESDTTDEFTIYIYRAGGSERYQKCHWMNILLENVPGGIRRRRVARTWDRRSLNTE